MSNSCTFLYFEVLKNNSNFFQESDRLRIFWSLEIDLSGCYIWEKGFRMLPALQADRKHCRKKKKVYKNCQKLK